MISLYTGPLGSGKSFHALEIALKVLKEKKYGQDRYVIANYPLIPKPDMQRGPAWFKNRVNAIRKNEFERWIFNDSITIEFLVAESIKRGWYGKESMCMVEIDEAGIIFNARDWQIMAASRNKWIKFFALSRKFGYDFIFVAQNDRMVDKQIRGLVEYEVRHLKANNSFLFSFLSIFRITMFMYIYQWYQTKLRGNMRLSRYKRSVADRYDTMRIFQFDDLIDSIKDLYAGKIIPAPVAFQINLWSEEKIKRALEVAQAELEQALDNAVDSIDLLDEETILNRVIEEYNIEQDTIDEYRKWNRINGEKFVKGR